MKRKTMIILALVLIAGLAAFSGYMLFWPKVLFEEDFESFSPGNWTESEEWVGLEDGGWTVVDESTRCIQAGDKQCMIGIGDMKWKDYTLTARVRPGNAAEHGIAVRFNKGYDDYYELCFTNWADGQGVVKLWKIVDGYIEKLGDEVPFTYDFETFYDTKMTIKGETIKCYVEDMDKPIINYTDKGTSMGNPLRKGMIGLYSEGKACFDDVRVMRE